MYDINANKEEETKETFNLSKSDSHFTETSECNGTSYCHIELSITYKPQTDDFPSVVLNLAMVYNQSRIPGYWEWSNLAVELKMNKTTTITTSLNVAPVPGHTKHTPADINCQRDYTVCAPKGLSWTCDDEIFKDSKDTSKNQSDLLKITFPGLKLQPFFDSNGTEIVRYVLQ